MRNFIPSQWRVAEIILVLKPAKNATNIKSYRTISVLPTRSKVLDILFLSHRVPVIMAAELIPEHQFGFSPFHNTIEHMQRIVVKVTRLMRITYGVFLQAFDNV